MEEKTNLLDDYKELTILEKLKILQINVSLSDY